MKRAAWVGILIFTLIGSIPVWSYLHSSGWAVDKAQRAGFGLKLGLFWFVLGLFFRGVGGRFSS